jgi:hypothetical protein
LKKNCANMKQIQEQYGGLMKAHIVLAFLILLSVTGCNNTIEIGLEHSPTDAANLPATSAPVQVPTNTIIVPAATVPQPSSTVQVPGATLLPTDLPGQSTVQIFMIAVDDNGLTGSPVGCGDSVIPVQVQIPPTQGVLKAALTALLSVKDQFYGQSGLYNALYQSDLQVESVKIDAGKASVYLTGNLTLGGECDTPRVQAQLEQTVLQFPTVTDAVIYINGKPLADVLSLKGTEAQPSPTESLVQVFLIAMDDNGQGGVPVGCGDSAIPVQFSIQPTQGVMRAALETLLSIKDQYYGQSDLYNALYQSDLLVEKISIINGKASVYLTGNLNMGGECDAPRIQAQLEQTVLQFSTVTEAAIYINGRPLADVLSLKG